LAGELSLVDGAEDDLEIWETSGAKLDSGEGVTLIRGGDQKSFDVDDPDEVSERSELLLADDGGNAFQEEKSKREKSLDMSRFEDNKESVQVWLNHVLEHNLMGQSYRADQPVLRIRLISRIIMMACRKFQ
jgi:hypothetical protein